MNITLKSFALPAIVALSSISVATAQTFSGVPNHDTVLVGFQTPDNPGSALNLEVDFGNVYSLTSFVGETTTFNISGDLTTDYGSGWNGLGSRPANDITFGGISTSGSSGDGIAAPNTLFATLQTKPTGASQTAPSGWVTQYLNGLNGQSVGGLSNTANVSTSDSGSYTFNYNANGAPKPFAYFNAFDADTDFSADNGTNGAPITEKFYELVPGATNGIFLGTFSLDSAGDLSFTSAVPEPSTWVVGALATGVLVAATLRRRRQSITGSGR